MKTMTCTHVEITPAGLASASGRAVYRGDDMTAIVRSAHRGGCLYASETFLRDDRNGRHCYISAGDGIGMHSEIGDVSAYLMSLAKHHLRGEK